MCLLNNGTLTYVNTSSGNHSDIDLTSCNPTVYTDFTWKVHDETCGSDHFPILIKSTEPISEKGPPESYTRPTGKYSRKNAKIS